MDSLTRLLQKSIEHETNKRATKLIDFTYEQLKIANSAMEEMRAEAINALSVHEEIGTNPDHEKVTFWRNRADIANLWMTQLMDAMVHVKHEENIQSN